MRDHLTDYRIKSLDAREKPYKVVDGAGLYLELRPNGKKYWKFKCCFAGKEKTLTIGLYGGNYSISRKEKTGKRSCRRRYSLVN
jgi:hypothetical protein